MRGQMTYGKVILPHVYANLSALQTLTTCVNYHAAVTLLVVAASYSAAF